MYSQHSVSFHQTLDLFSVGSENSILYFQLSPQPPLAKHTYKPKIKSNGRSLISIIW